MRYIEYVSCHPLLTFTLWQHLKGLISHYRQCCGKLYPPTEHQSKELVVHIVEVNTGSRKASDLPKTSRLTAPLRHIAQLYFVFYLATFLLNQNDSKLLIHNGSGLYFKEKKMKCWSRNWEGKMIMGRKAGVVFSFSKPFPLPLYFYTRKLQVFFLGNRSGGSTLLRNKSSLTYNNRSGLGQHLGSVQPSELMVKSWLHVRTGLLQVWDMRQRQ